MSALAAACAGILFALGLALGGMTDPANVTGFLDVAGDWNPRLAFVMGGALAVHALLRPIVLRRAKPVFDTVFHEPAAAPIDLRLVGGSAVFGIGWGLTGYCPGPAVVALGGGGVPVLVFVLAMLVGMLVDRVPGLAPPAPGPRGAPAEPGLVSRA